MVISAPFMRSLAQGSVWQLPSEDPGRKREDAAEPGNRRADAFVGVVDYLVEGLDDKQRLGELLRDLSVGLRGIRRTLEERKTQWVDRRRRVTVISAEECVRSVRAGQMTMTEARNELMNAEDEGHRWI
jgi:hypothetical protein